MLMPRAKLRRMSSSAYNRPVRQSDQPPERLIQVLRAQQRLPSDAEILPMHGGRTNGVWHVRTSSGRGLVLKLYDPAAGSVLFPNDPAAEARALRSLGPKGLAPEYVAHGTDPKAGAWLLYLHEPGPIWNGNVKQAAQALADIHAVEHPIEGLRVSPGGSANLIRQGEALLANCANTERVRQLRAARPAVHAGPVQTLGLIHGDPVPGNMLCSPDGAFLIDWQCPAMGDAAEDLAVFLSPAMQLLYRGTLLADEDTCAFLAAYPVKHVVARYQMLRPLFNWRMACYCLNRWNAGHHDYAEGYRLEADQLGLSDIGEHQ